MIHTLVQPLKQHSAPQEHLKFRALIDEHSGFSSPLQILFLSTLGQVKAEVVLVKIIGGRVVVVVVVVVVGTVGSEKSEIQVTHSCN